MSQPPRSRSERMNGQLSAADASCSSSREAVPPCHCDTDEEKAPAVAPDTCW